jgi:hypothetical protein
MRPNWYHTRVNVSIKGLDPDVVARLAAQAEIEGVSAQEWMRSALGRTAALLTPTELTAHAAGRTPVPESDYRDMMAQIVEKRSAKTRAKVASERVRNRGR